MKPGHVPEPGEVATPTQLGHLAPRILEAVRAGTPLLAIPQANTLSDGVAQQLADAGAFTFHGNVGDFRAPWMGNWYFVREHPLFAGIPVNQVMGLFYQSPGRQSNGLLIDRAQASKSSPPTPATTTATSARAPSPPRSARAKSSTTAAPTSTPSSSSASSPTPSAGSPADPPFFLMWT